MAQKCVVCIVCGCGKGAGVVMSGPFRSEKTSHIWEFTTIVQHRQVPAKPRETPSISSNLRYLTFTWYAR